MMATLEDKGFVIRDKASDRYRLGMRVWELSAQLSGDNDPAVVWQPEMERLRDMTGETVSLYIRDGKERIRLQAVQSNQAVRRVAPVGVRLPLFVGAASKVLIAFAEPAARNELLSEAGGPLPVDRTSYMEQLEEIRRVGYAISVEERESGAAAVSAPILDRSGRLAAALSVSGPVSRLSADALHRLAPSVIEAARRMGKMMRG
jgi:DNA-binding IclR family transcriptional regulator